MVSWDEIARKNEQDRLERQAAKDRQKEKDRLDRDNHLMNMANTAMNYKQTQELARQTELMSREREEHERREREQTQHEEREARANAVFRLIDSAKESMEAGDYKVAEELAINALDKGWTGFVMRESELPLETEARVVLVNSLAMQGKNRDIFSQLERIYKSASATDFSPKHKAKILEFACQFIDPLVRSRSDDDEFAKGAGYIFLRELGLDDARLKPFGDKFEESVLRQNRLIAEKRENARAEVKKYCNGKMEECSTLTSANRLEVLVLFVSLALCVLGLVLASTSYRWEDSYNNGVALSVLSGVVFGVTVLLFVFFPLIDHFDLEARSTPYISGVHRLLVKWFIMDYRNDCRDTDDQALFEQCKSSRIIPIQYRLLISEYQSERLCELKEDDSFERALAVLGESYPEVPISGIKGLSL